MLPTTGDVTTLMDIQENLELKLGTLCTSIQVRSHVGIADLTSHIAIFERAAHIYASLVSARKTLAQIEHLAQSPCPGPRDRGAHPFNEDDGFGNEDQEAEDTQNAQDSPPAQSPSRNSANTTKTKSRQRIGITAGDLDAIYYANHAIAGRPTPPNFDPQVAIAAIKRIVASGPVPAGLGLPSLEKLAALPPLSAPSLNSALAAPHSALIIDSSAPPASSISAPSALKNYASIRAIPACPTLLDKDVGAILNQASQNIDSLTADVTDPAPEAGRATLSGDSSTPSSASNRALPKSDLQVPGESNSKTADKRSPAPG